MAGTLMYVQVGKYDDFNFDAILGTSRVTLGYPSIKKHNKFLNKILASKVPRSPIIVGQLVSINAVRNGRLGGGWLSNPN